MKSYLIPCIKLNICEKDDKQNSHTQDDLIKFIKSFIQRGPKFLENYFKTPYTKDDINQGKCKLDYIDYSSFHDP